MRELTTKETGLVSGAGESGCETKKKGNNGWGNGGDDGVNNGSFNGNDEQRGSKSADDAR